MTKANIQGSALPSTLCTLWSSEMLRWACTFATEQGVEVHAPVQDALLVGGRSEEIEDALAATRKAMAQASDLVLDGFVLRSDVNIVRFPDRYFDKRGVQMWNRVMKLLQNQETASEVLS
jgi:DNA polymerase I